MSASIDDRFAASIRPATSADVAAMARIHHDAGTPGLLRDLGEPFLRDVYYRGLTVSPLGRALVLDIAGDIRGFVTFSPRSGRLFRDIFVARPMRTARALGAATLHKPRLPLDFAATVMAGLRVAADEPEAEVVSLEVSPSVQGLGLGVVLLRRAVRDLAAEGADRVKARILADHVAVKRIYDDLGFTSAGRFRLHGRDWMMLYGPGPVDTGRTAD